MTYCQMNYFYLADLEGRKRVRSRPALPRRAMGSCWPCGQPDCCPLGSGRSPAEAGRPKEGAGLLLRSCCRSAARAFSRRRPCPVLAFLLHCLQRTSRNRQPST